MCIILYFLRKTHICRLRLFQNEPFLDALKHGGYLKPGRNERGDARERRVCFCGGERQAILTRSFSEPLY
jgi:hypothetical protein